MEEEQMKVSELIKYMASTRGITQKELAAKLGTSPQNMNGRLKSNAFSAEEFRRIAGILGFTVEIKDIDSGADVTETIKTKHPRVKKLVNGITVDTSKSELLCTADITSTICLELYKDCNGYFILYRHGIQNTSVVLIDKTEAKRIYALYGSQAIYAYFFSE